MSGAGIRHWVLIETSANQAYIFDTNRLRHVVGASHLIYQVGTAWVPEMARSCGAEVVLAISGKALLLVDDPGAARTVIGTVSARALKEAPGLEVTGVVGPGFDPALRWQPEPDAGQTRPLTHVEALDRTYELLELARQERPAPELRDPMLPWFEVCRESGLPVAGIEEHPEPRLAAAGVLAKAAARPAARNRMRDLFAAMPDVVPHGGDDLRDDGWIAVIHADGNGVGKLFTDFPRRALAAARDREDGMDGLSLDRHVQLLAGFTRELDGATREALEIAVREATRDEDAAATILPVVVGGDDVTVVCHARFALDLACRFELAFEEQTAARPMLRAVAGGGLTAAAGIAFVKPHHPFSAAYSLAEELTASAKRVTHVDGRKVSAVDLHVAFESTLSDLATLRRRMAMGGLPRNGGPYVITAEDGPRAGPRDIAELDRAMATVSALSSSMAHDLREGLVLGEAEYARRLRLAALSPGLPAGVRAADIEHLAPTLSRDDGSTQEAKIVRLLDALLLRSITGGQPTGEPARPADAEPAGAPR